jgi:ribonuclease HI
VNWDISIDSIRRCMGVRIIVRDRRGRVRAAQCKQMKMMPDPTTGESMGVLLAAEFTHARGFQDITVEGDAMNVVNAISGKDMTWSPYG